MASVGKTQASPGKLKEIAAVAEAFSLIDAGYGKKQSQVAPRKPARLTR
ncbi:MAG: hypothetical protein WBP94_16480 [Rhodomicrobiaceae bacterium]